MSYYAFCDPSGGQRDAFTLGIAHVEDGIATLDCLKERIPPFSPESVVEEYVAVLKRYRIFEVVGDRYGGEWPREQFAKRGIRYRVSDLTRSDIYLEFLPALTSGKVRLLDNARLIAQLVGLERRTARGGKDSVDHAPGGHDDLANSAAGALVLALQGAGDKLGLITLLREMGTGIRDAITGAKIKTRDVLLGPGFSLHPPEATPATTATLNAGAAHKPVKANVSTPACVSCGSGLVLRIGQQWHCNQCSCDFSLDGAILTPPPAEQCCARPLIQRIGGCGDRCANCGTVVSGRPVHAPAGAASRREYLDRSEDRSDWRNLLGPPRRN